jgi:hypothetical protein
VKAVGEGGGEDINKKVRYFGEGNSLDDDTCVKLVD